MRFLLPLVVSSLLSGLGWWLGSFVGFMTAYFCGVLLASVGWYLGRRMARNLAD